MDCVFAGGELDGAMWDTSAAPMVSDIVVENDRFPPPRVRRRAKQGGNLRRLALMFFFDDDEETEEEDEENEDKEEEEENASNAGEDASYVPLISEVQDTAVEMAAEAAGQAADWLEGETSRKLDEAKAQLMKVIQSVDARAKPQAQALQKLLNSSRFRNLLDSAPATRKILELISKTSNGQKVTKTLEEVSVELRNIQEKGAAPLLQKLLNSQLEARTGYSSGQLLRIFRITAVEMARDTRELKKLQTYLEKLQETVNENNWDDVADNFSTFYALQRHLQGERSQQVFQMIWKSPYLRQGVLFLLHDKFVLLLSFLLVFMMFKK